MKRRNSVTSSARRLRWSSRRGAAPVKAEAVFFSAARSASCCGSYQLVS